MRPARYRYTVATGCIRTDTHRSSVGLMPTEARGNYLPEPLIYARQRPITASHSSRYDMLAIISSDINTAHFLFFCCRSYVKLLDY